ncbi:MBL fold metallo-hydrolase [Tichowtungia aerotolerans]|uniref:MBL fold metallo-hydrolase n=1 Tax=Tichowtungia aerotolerans TaxID=2697043 RepID=A0A6P1M517_9BACT|nr:MBL fold metallo-hydrolase [Tichowtungia aerotolerans]QHI68093.1 MBL fold metallo-hydrolase [Tichowtungia aerotolerans]
MSIKLCVLASGSSGNSIFIGTESTRILIDAGLSAKKVTERLAEIGENPENLDAICVTHEHSDHIAGIRVLQRKHGIPVYANGGTLDGIRAAHKGTHELICCQFTTGSSFEIGDLCLEPFSIPHDAYEPVGFVVRNGVGSIGVATDIGIATNLLRQKLRACDVVVIEANHEESMVHEAPRPWSLKQRILSNQGHLSNRASAELIAQIAGERLKHLFLAHLSSDCNSPSLARRVFETVLAEAGHDHVTVCLTGAHQISELLELKDD